MGGWQGGIPLYLVALGRNLAQFSPAAPSASCSEMSRRSPEPPTAMANARLSSRRFLRYKRWCCTPLRPQHDKVIGVRAAPP